MYVLMKVVLCCIYSEAIAVRWGNKGNRIYLLNYYFFFERERALVREFPDHFSHP